MRLLKDEDHESLSLVEKHEADIPRYAILSHTWGPDGEEATFKDFIEGTFKDKIGYNKIDFCRRQAASDGLQHFWVDTCCIDKSSSAELGEAVNSMFRWYRNAEKCYVYLSDVSSSGHAIDGHSLPVTLKAAFQGSKWFTRGWTLQELLAPATVEFFSREGDNLGSKRSLEQDIQEITRIAVGALRGGPLTDFEVEERFFWMNHRETKRQEDKAYSLLGVFNIYLPLIYGEGRKNAFARLREAISGTFVVQEQKHQRHRTITDWISAIDFAPQQSDIISRRQEGTGTWFTDSAEFMNWLDGSHQTLFCPGIPGAGKTMVAATAVDHLYNSRQDRKDVGIAYIYFNYKTQAEQKAADLAAAILKQLIQERPSAAEPVASLYDRHANRRTRPSLREILSALQAVVSSYSKIYVVVDALDECRKDARSQLLVMLHDLQSNRNLSFMATSRFIPEVMKHFSRLPTLEIRASDSDVKSFVASQISLLPEFVQSDSELQTAIRDGISTAVDGMFLLALLYMNLLLDKNTKREILSTLDRLTRGSEALEEAYKSAIERIEGQREGSRRLARRVLSWITYAQRPLTTTELSYALAVKEGDSELDPDNIPDVADMVSVCAGLVTVDEESNIIRLFHYTTQEYFENVRESWNPQAQQEITSACLTYLAFDLFKSGSCQGNKELDSRLSENIFLDYASRYWGQHARTVQEQVLKLALRFLQDTNSVSCAVQTMSMSEFKYSNYSQNFPHQATGLHLTASFGLLYLSEGLLSEIRVSISDSKDKDGRTPLSWAAERGHEAAVELLVKRDDVIADSKDKDGRTPLSYAAEEGYEAIVKLLLKRDDVIANSKDQDGWTPLSYAAFEGHEAVVKLLLKRDDVTANPKDWGARTPLSYAASKGYEAVVKLLLQRNDITANSRDVDGLTPLSYAAEEGHEAVVKLLLKRNDIIADCKDYFDRTPLSHAAYEGHERVVELLVQHNDVIADSKDIFGQTSLSWAAQGGHEAVVELLLKRDDVIADSKDKDGWTPLSHAIEEGHEAVVELLRLRHS